MLLLYQHIFQADYHCRFKDIYLGWYLFLSSSSVQSDFQYPEHWSIVVKALGRPQLKFLVYCESSRCFLKQWGLTISLWREANSLGNSSGCLGFCGAPLANNLFICTVLVQMSDVDLSNMQVLSTKMQSKVQCVTSEKCSTVLANFISALRNSELPEQRELQQQLNSLWWF